MSIESLMPSNHLILCHPLLLLPSIFPNIRVFSNESALCIRWLKYWSFSISPSNENSGLISLGLTILIFLLSKGLSRVLSTTIWKHQFTGAQPSLWSNSHICTWQLEKNIALASGWDGKASVHNEGYLGLIPGSGSSPAEGNGNPLQYSCLENSMDGGTWWATVHGVTKSWTRLSDFTSLG